MQSELECYGGQGKQAPTLVPSPFFLLRPLSEHIKPKKC
jgi:hypothetical protein